jgi:hypothetical protein
MSAPSAEDWIVLSWLKSPKATPPLELVVQRVIGPPDVPNNLGLAALVPPLEEMRPAALTMIPLLPARILAFSATAPELRISTIPREVIGAPLVKVEELDSRTVPALIAPVPVVLTVDAALEIATSWSAVIVDVVFLV